jgi:hypothetical protein
MLLEIAAHYQKINYLLLKQIDLLSENLGI